MYTNTELRAGIVMAGPTTFTVQLTSSTGDLNMLIIRMQ